MPSRARHTVATRRRTAPCAQARDQNTRIGIRTYAIYTYYHNAPQRRTPRVLPLRTPPWSSRSCAPHRDVMHAKHHRRSTRSKWLHDVTQSKYLCGPCLPRSLFCNTLYDAAPASRAFVRVMHARMLELHVAVRTPCCASRSCEENQRHLPASGSLRTGRMQSGPDSKSAQLQVDLGRAALTESKSNR